MPDPDSTQAQTVSAAAQAEIDAGIEADVTAWGNAIRAHLDRLDASGGGKQVKAGSDAPNFLRRTLGRLRRHDPDEVSLAARAKAPAAQEVLWRLGAGGVSKTHCPQCVEIAERGWMPVGSLEQQPGDGSTFCGSACDCSLDYRDVPAPDFQQVHFPGSGFVQRARGTRE
jgi:hypothetical protein